MCHLKVRDSVVKQQILGTVIGEAGLRDFAVPSRSLGLRGNMRAWNFVCFLARIIHAFVGWDEQAVLLVGLRSLI